MVAASIIGGIRYDSFASLIGAALLLGILNAFLRPVLLLLAAPLIILTLGMFIFVVNGLMLLLVNEFVHGFHVDSFGSAFWGAILISIVSWILSAFFRGSDGRVHPVDASYPNAAGEGRVVQSSKPGESMTYCLGMLCRQGAVFLSDSRTSAGMDNITVRTKMRIYEKPDDRVICIMSSGNLSLTQATLALIDDDLHLHESHPARKHLMNRETLYETVRYVGSKVREVEQRDRAALEADGFDFNINLIVGGQIAGLAPEVHSIYPQGNSIHASKDCPFLQIGESKYGKPILDRGFSYDGTLMDALKFGIISMDATMKSNVAVGPPIDILCYKTDSLQVKMRTRLEQNDPYLMRSAANGRTGSSDSLGKCQWRISARPRSALHRRRAV